MVDALVKTSSQSLAPGKAWVFGDNIDTDAMAPSAYLMKEPQEAVAHCMESIDANFARQVNTGDVFVAGINLGLGSSRESAPFNLQQLGIRAILAKSYARIFYRNALNLGLITLICPDTQRINTGDSLSVDPIQGIVHNHTAGESLQCDPLPDHLLRMIQDGGLLAHVKKRFR